MRMHAWTTGAATCACGGTNELLPLITQSNGNNDDTASHNEQWVAVTPRFIGGASDKATVIFTPIPSEMLNSKIRKNLCVELCGANEAKNQTIYAWLNVETVIQTGDRWLVIATQCLQGQQFKKYCLQMSWTNHMQRLQLCAERATQRLRGIVPGRCKNDRTSLNLCESCHASVLPDPH
eukprot:m.1427790 g.1427790  ORF g.1427790 m.1427790 type:complete len:179 (+) comp25066_c0_seq17:5323-5859(+)